MLGVNQCSLYLWQSIISLPESSTSKTKCGEKGCTIVPRENTLLQGHFATDEPDHDIIREFVKEFGQEVDIEGHYINFDSGMHFPLQAAQTAAANNAVLFIKIEPFSGKRLGLDKSDYLNAINEGAFDDLFIAMGREIRKFGKPVMLTFGHEMNIEGRGGEAYQWAGSENAEKFKKAFMRVHDLISKEMIIDPKTGKEKKCGGANNVTWVLNFDAGVYHRLYSKYNKPEEIKKHLEKFTPDGSYFDIVAVDGYINDNAEKKLEAKEVIHRLFTPIFSAIAQSEKLKDKDLFVGEFGVNSQGVGMKEERKAELITAFLDYLVEFNQNPNHPKKIIGYLYFDVKKKKMGGGDEGNWKIESEEAKKAYQKWLNQHSQLFKDPPFFSQKDTNKIVKFQGLSSPVPEAKIDFSTLPEKNVPDDLKDWEQQPKSPPKESRIGGYNYKLGLSLLDRWMLEKFIDREGDAGKKLMEAGINALLRIDPDVPLTFNVSSYSFQNFKELVSLREADQNLPESVALLPYFDNPKAYWENVTTFISVYAQKAIEDQDEERIKNAAKVCELLIRRYEKQKSLEAGIAEKNYAYPTHHNLALLKLTLADAYSQLKNLDEEIYKNAISHALEAIQLFQKLERNEKVAFIPAGADYFSIAKAIITIGDLKVRIAQIYTQEKAFNKADQYFRDAEMLYQSVADLDVSRKKGLEIDREVLPGKRLKFEVGIESMLNSWKNNLSLGYIRYQDKLRGFQGTFHFLKALASIKIQAAFLENPTKKPEDYQMKNLFDRLLLLQNSITELTRDPELKIDFLKGLAYLAQAQLLIMIGDRAQYDAGMMDSFSALTYFNCILKKLSENVYYNKQLMTPPTKTAGASKRFALIITSLVNTLAEEVYELSQTSQEKVRFPYLFIASNLLRADMAVRNSYITETPINVKTTYQWINDARKYMTKEKFQNWFRFQANLLEASINILRNEPGKESLSKAIGLLESALKNDLNKFIESSQVFYKAEILLLEALAYILLGNPKKAKEIVTELTKLIPEIEKISPQIGWNLKDFWVRYSRIIIRSTFPGTIKPFLPHK